MAGAAVAACDAGKQHDQPTKGPLILIRGLNVGAGRDMPEDGVVQIAVDRYLLPLYVTRQSVSIVDGSGRPLPAELAPNVLYDPIARAVTLTRPALDRPWLTPGVPYKVRLAIPKSEDDVSGLRAIDGATLDPGQPLEYSFFVAKGAGPPRTLAETLGEAESISFCNDVLPIFKDKCGGSACHGSRPGATPLPASGLLLDTPDGIRTTALNRIAQGTNVGSLAGQARAESRQFGVDMPIVAVSVGSSPPVGSPGNSWLIYKIDMADVPADPGTKPPVFAGLAPVIAGTDPREKSILENLVLGSEMPYPGYGDPLTFQERETVRMWISRGAPAPDCPR